MNMHGCRKENTQKSNMQKVYQEAEEGEVNAGGGRHSATAGGQQSPNCCYSRRCCRWRHDAMRGRPGRPPRRRPLSRRTDVPRLALALPPHPRRSRLYQPAAPRRVCCPQPPQRPTQQSQAPLRTTAPPGAAASGQGRRRPRNRPRNRTRRAPPLLQRRAATANPLQSPRRLPTRVRRAESATATTWPRQGRLQRVPTSSTAGPPRQVGASQQEEELKSLLPLLLPLWCQQKPPSLAASHRHCCRVGPMPPPPPLQCCRRAPRRS